MQELRSQADASFHWRRAAPHPVPRLLESHAASEHNESELQALIPVRDSTITINPVLMIHFGEIMSQKQLKQI